MKKSLTLISFICLITTFVLYKAGVFDKFISSAAPHYQTSPNGGATNQVTIQKDTMPQNNQDSAKPIKEKTIMWSSKYAAPINPKEIKISNDAIIKKSIPKNDSATKVLQTKKTPKQEQIIWSGSKSGPVFKSSDTLVQKIIMMKLKEDSLKMKQ